MTDTQKPIDTTDHESAWVKFARFICPIVSLSLLIFFGVFYHATWWMWVVCVAIHVAGDAYEAYQLRDIGDIEGQSCYYAMVIAAALMGILAGTQPLTFHH